MLRVSLYIADTKYIYFLITKRDKSISSSKFVRIMNAISNKKIIEVVSLDYLSKDQF